MLAGKSVTILIDAWETIERDPSMGIDHELRGALSTQLLPWAKPPLEPFLDYVIHLPDLYHAQPAASSLSKRQRDDLRRPFEFYVRGALALGTVNVGSYETILETPPDQLDLEYDKTLLFQFSPDLPTGGGCDGAAVFAMTLNLIRNAWLNRDTKSDQSTKVTYAFKPWDSNSPRPSGSIYQTPDRDYPEQGILIRVTNAAKEPQRSKLTDTLKDTPRVKRGLGLVRFLVEDRFGGKMACAIEGTIVEITIVLPT